MPDQVNQLVQTDIRNIRKLGHFENTCSGTSSRVPGCACAFYLILPIDIHHEVHDRHVGYSGICMCAATELVALESLHGAVHVRQCFAAPAPAHTATHMETPLPDWARAIFFIQPQPQPHIRRRSLSD